MNNLVLDSNWKKSEVKELIGNIANCFKSLSMTHMYVIQQYLGPLVEHAHYTHSDTGHTYIVAEDTGRTHTHTHTHTHGGGGRSAVRALEYDLKVVGSSFRPRVQVPAGAAGNSSSPQSTF